MRRTIALLTACLIICSCKQNAQSSHLPQKKMQAMLQDIHLAEAYSIIVGQDSTRRTNGRNLDSLASYYQIIFKHYKTDQKEFEKSLQWYKQNPQELDSIYSRMIDQVTILEGKYNTRKP